MHIHQTDSIYFSVCEVGSYNIIYIHDCSIYCPCCLKEAIENKEEWTLPIEGSDSIMNDEISRHTNWEQINLYCSVCEKNLPLEYGDTVEVMMEFIGNIDETSNEDEIEQANEYREILKENGYQDYELPKHEVERKMIQYTSSIRCWEITYSDGTKIGKSMYSDTYFELE